MTPSKMAVIVMKMAAKNPKERPSALELVDIFMGTGRVGPNEDRLKQGSCCYVS